ncbi:hypothetical protein [Bacillus sp. FSL K6-0268]|uniref:hypothetical protein n=1 Tax=Bacillus sp. FSL K6-0268 TaxID=2921449 RepID=UPI0030F77488
MKLILTKIYEINKIYFISTSRKTFEDWNLKIKKIWLLVFSIFILTIISSYSMGIIVNKTFKISSDTTISFTLLFLFLEQFFWSITFFKNKTKFFILDLSKFINQNKQNRIIQIHAFFFRESLKKNLILILLYVPFIISTTNFPYVYLSILIILYGLFSYILLTIFSLLNFIYTKFLNNLIQKFSFIQNFLILLLTMIIGFSIGYITNISINSFNTILNFLKTDAFNLIANYTPYLFIYKKFNLFMITLLMFFMFIISTMIILIWNLVLKKHDLISYFNSRNTTYKTTSLLTRKYRNRTLAIMAKDITFIVRINSWFFNNISNMLFLFMLLLGFLLPLGSQFIKIYPIQTLIISSFIIANFFFTIIGDSFKTILSVDSESKNSHIFTNNIRNLWDIVSPKTNVYYIFVTFISLLLALILYFILDISFSNILFFMIVFMTSGFLNGIYQITSTGLYPKLNWENYQEIGESSKAKTYANISGGIIFIFFLQMGTLSSYLVTKGYSTDIILFSSATIMIIICILNHIILRLFLKKISFYERFVQNVKR